MLLKTCLPLQPIHSFSVSTLKQPTCWLFWIPSPEFWRHPAFLISQHIRRISGCLSCEIPNLRETTIAELLINWWASVRLSTIIFLWISVPVYPAASSSALLYRCTENFFKLCWGSIESRFVNCYTVPFTCLFRRYTLSIYAERLVDLSRIYSFWRDASNLQREESRRYLWDSHSK